MWKNGAFTKALLEAIAGKADTSSDGLISMKELIDYTTTRTSDLVQAQFKKQQHPDLSRNKYENFILFSY